MSRALIADYYAAFNRADFAAMLAMVSDDVAHDINQGKCEVGREAFTKFLAHMDHCYLEQIADLVIMEEPSGQRFAAEFDVVGSYLKTDPGFPEASGQAYRLRAGAFLEVRDSRIARVTTYYNVREWLAQIGA
jgi:steroid delta-isomerase-like uncharacterized protein